MSGIFIGHHNTKQVFGFQYLNQEDLDDVISGSAQEAEQMFLLCVGTLESILRKVVPTKAGVVRFSVLGQ